MNYLILFRFLLFIALILPLTQPYMSLKRHRRRRSRRWRKGHSSWKQRISAAEWLSFFSEATEEPKTAYEKIKTELGTATQLLKNQDPTIPETPSLLPGNCSWIQRSRAGHSSAIQQSSRAVKGFGGCKVAADVAFIVDSSGSVGFTEWHMMLRFMKKIIRDFNVGPNGTHVAVVAFSTRAKLEFPFNAISGDRISAEEYGKRIDMMRLQRGYTYIDKALQLANEQVFVTSAGMRLNVPKIAIVITDGQQTRSRRYTPLSIASKGIKDKGVAVYSLGLGSSVNNLQLQQIASSRSNVFISAGSDELADAVKTVVKKVCPKTTPRPIPEATDEPKTAYEKIKTELGIATQFLKNQDPPIPEIPSLLPVCDQLSADYAFVMDASGSILPREFIILKTFVKRVIDVLPIGPNQTRVGVIEFSRGASVQLDFSTSYDKREIKSFVDKVPHTAGITRIDLALKAASEQLFTPQRGMRASSKKVMVFLTDGNQTGIDLIPNQTPLVDAIQPIKDLGVKVIAIGIGPVDREQMKTLATAPSDILQVKSFQDFLTFVKETVNKSCRGGVSQSKSLEYI